MIYRAGDHILTLAAAPANGPVSRVDMKEHLRVDITEDDSLIAAYMDAALACLDDEIGRAFITQSWDESFQNPTRDVYLGKLPVASLTSVKYYDADNVQQTATLSDFTLYKSDDWAFVRSDAWPATYDRPDAITIRYVAGADEADPRVGQAMKLIVDHWYQNRSDVSALSLKEMPRAVAHLVEQLRGGWYGA